jgi:5-methylthioadenosine/S-adenosylhomocysteine deaminase
MEGMGSRKVRKTTGRRCLGGLLVGILCLVGCSGGERRMEPVDLLIVGGRVLPMDGRQSQFEAGYVAVRGEKIVAVGSMEERPLDRFRALSVVHAEGKAVLPGLINGHTHLAMTLLRGMADDLDLQEWLTRHIFPAEARNLSRGYVVTGTQLGLVEMIRGGVTTYVDMYYFEDAVAEVTAQAGLRGILGETLIDFPVPDNPTWEQAMASTEQYLGRWAEHPLIVPAVAPHSLYTVSEAHWRESIALANRFRAPILTHLAEAADETAYARTQFGKRPVAYLDGIGLFSSPSPVVVAHAVHLVADEIDLLASRDVGVVHCPESNMKLSSGTAPIPGMLAKRVRLGIGTDGAASNNNLDLWQEIDTAAKLHKLISGDPTVVTADEVLGMATIGGARALHLEDRIGSLEPGKLADLILVGMEGAHQTPMYHLVSHLVYANSAADVTDTMVHGKWLMRNRRLLTLDETAIRREALRYQAAVVKSLAGPARSKEALRGVK